MNKIRNLAVTGVATVAVFVVALFSFTTASAVSLGVKSVNTLTVQQAVACAQNTLTVTVDATKHLQVGNIQPACYAQSMVAKVISPYAPSSILVSGVVNANTVTFSSSPAIDTVDSVDSVKILIDGWEIPATWTWVNSNPIVPDASTDGISVNTTWDQPSSLQFCANITVTTSSSSPLPWKVNLVITGQPFNNDTNASHYHFNTTDSRFQSPSPTNGRFIVVGATSATSTVTASTPRYIQICNYSVPRFTGPSTDPDVGYNQSETTPQRAYYVCKTVTVSVTGSPQFYVGWEAIVDITNLRNNYMGQGGTVHINSGDYAVTYHSGSTYHVTGTGYSTNGIKDGHPNSFEICWGA